MIGLSKAPISTRKATQVSEKDSEAEEVCSSSVKVTGTVVPQKGEVKQGQRRKEGNSRAIPRDVANVRLESRSRRWKQGPLLTSYFKPSGESNQGTFSSR